MTRVQISFVNGNDVPFSEIANAAECIKHPTLQTIQMGRTSQERKL